MAWHVLADRTVEFGDVPIGPTSHVMALAEVPQGYSANLPDDGLANTATPVTTRTAASAYAAAVSLIRAIRLRIPLALPRLNDPGQCM